VLLSHKFTETLPAAVAVPGASPKLGARGWGPFEVLKVLSDVVVKLQLPDEWKQHAVVHASYLIPWQEESEMFPDRAPPPPDPDVIDGEEHFVVEAFRDHMWRGKQLWLKVKWLGYPEEENKWRPYRELAEDVDDEFLAEFIEGYRQARQLPVGFHTKPPKKQTRR
jgi:hypothetical protein